MDKRAGVGKRSYWRNGLAIVAFLFQFVEANAFHIVGGEIEMIHIGGFSYQINLIQYFDRAQQFNPGPEPQIVIFTYRKSDRFEMRRDTLPLINEVAVEYTNPNCAIAELQTSRVVFSTIITLDPEDYDDPEGYFLVWERCCRNGSVVNINNPLDTGMTYTVEFPPLMKDGAPFVNSTPSIFPPLSDFACVGELYYANFAGTDFDGDSIAYRLVEPLNSSSLTAIPIPQYPDPNRQVVWVDGIDTDNIIPGTPSLNISAKGLLTVRPSNPGLHVFAAIAEEFRDGVRIGEARRDFQLLVIDGCEPGSPPNVQARKPDGNLYQEGEIYQITTIDPRCFEFLVTDADGGENISLRAEGVNFDQDVSEIFSVTSGFIAGTTDILNVTVCIPECPYLQDENFIIDLIAGDDSCPLPRLDTLRMTFDVEPPPNDPPTWDRDVVDVSIFEGQVLAPPEIFVGSDGDMDTLDVRILNSEFDPEQFGMTFSPVIGFDGSISTTYNLDGDCIEHDFGIQNEFELLVALEDRDQCGYFDADTLLLNVEVVLPPNSDPVVTTSTGETVINMTLDELREFTVSAIDSDLPGDSVMLEAVGRELSLENLGVQFTSSQGFRSTESEFSWEFACNDIDLMGNSEFTIDFIATDGDKCKVPNADTLSVRFNLILPDNNAPSISGYMDGDVIDARVNAPIEQQIFGVDPDGDGLSIFLADGSEIGEVEGFEFPTVEGGSSISSTLLWTPDCSLLDGTDPSEIEASFILLDNSCPEPKADTVNVTFRVFDSPVSFDGFTPPNVITPNGDNFNQVFSLSGNEEPSFNLPPDSCGDTFIGVTIVNRYGKEVYESSEREFAWSAEALTEGTYYYHLTYTNSVFRGTLTVIE